MLNIYKNSSFLHYIQWMFKMFHLQAYHLTWELLSQRRPRYTWCSNHSCHLHDISSSIPVAKDMGRFKLVKFPTTVPVAWDTLASGLSVKHEATAKRTRVVSHASGESREWCVTRVESHEIWKRHEKYCVVLLPPLRKKKIKLTCSPQLSPQLEWKKKCFNRPHTMFIEHSKISSDKTVPTTKDYSVWISLQPLGILTLTLPLPGAIKKNFFLTIRRDEKNWKNTFGIETKMQQILIAKIKKNS